MKHHQNESSPSAYSSLLSQTLQALQKLLSAELTSSAQVGCLISVVIITMLLIDTGLSPTAAGPGETFDPHSLR